MKKILTVFATISLAFFACVKTNEVDEAKKTIADTTATVVDCDTTNMLYSANVLPIIQANCYSCHGNGNSEGAISLDTYDKLKRQVTNGNLIGTITHAAGYDPMPDNQPKMSDCDINKIKDWIARGTLNN